MSAIAYIADERIKRIHQRRVKEKREADRRKTGVEFPLSIHGGGCNGRIMYRSRIVPDTSKKAGLLGINPPMREEIACSCDGCHKPIDPAYPPFQQKIKAFFAGKVVDPTK